MDHCYSLTFTGQVERIEWHNPHVELIIRADSGESHRVIWLNIQGLKRAGIDTETLRAGDQVTVTVGTRDEIAKTPMLLAAITRASDGWEWSQVPQGC
jgi:L-asparaginase II